MKCCFLKTSEFECMSRTGFALFSFFFFEPGIRYFLSLNIVSVCECHNFLIFECM